MSVEGHGVSDQPFDPRSIDLVALVEVSPQGWH
jgi:hypothetical protein